MLEPMTRPLLLLGAGVLGASLTLLPAIAAPPEADHSDMPWADARLLAEVLERVKHDYVNPVDDHQLLQSAIRGMVSSLDPYSAFLDGDEYDEVKISSSGEYSGVGIEVSMEDDEVVVVSPLEGSPAALAGIRPGDIIAAIDGVPVREEYHHLVRHHPGACAAGRVRPSRSASCARATPNPCSSP